MEYARWHAKQTKVVSGATQEAHWRALAKRGDRTALRALSGPEFPESLRYLWRISETVRGRSGAHMGGLNPVSPCVLREHLNFMGQDLEPHEYEAVLALDAIALTADSKESDNGR